MLSIHAASVAGVTRFSWESPDPSVTMVEIAASVPRRSCRVMRSTLAPVPQEPCSRVTSWPMRLSRASA